MTPKEYLLQVRKLDQEINTRLEEREAMRKTMLKSNAITSTARASDSSTQLVDDTVEAFINYNDEVNEQVDQLVNLRMKISEQINEIKDSRYRQILSKYYLSEKSWEKVAADMHYGVRHVHKLHGEALKVFGSKHDIK